MAADFGGTQMTGHSGTRSSTPWIIILRIFDAVSVVITASAAVLLFIATPYSLLDRWHLLPNWGIFWIFFVFVPFIVVWDRAGFYLLLVVIVCQSLLVLLRPRSQKTQIIAVGSVVLCALTYVWIYVAHRFNIH